MTYVKSKVSLCVPEEITSVLLLKVLSMKHSFCAFGEFVRNAESQVYPKPPR